MRTGQIVDFYDDPTGLILKAKVAQADLPDFIKTAQFLDEAGRNKLPDDVFALVMVDTDQTLRKYACQDKGNTALSVLYFMETHDRLPEEAQKVAAANLLRACSWYDLQPPPQLHKLAGKEEPEKLGSKNVRQQARRIYEEYKMWPGRKPDRLRGGTWLRHRQLERLMGEKGQPALGKILKPIEQEKLRNVKPKTKHSELVGSETMPKSGPEKNAAGVEGNPDDSFQNPGREEPQKLGSLQPYVDVTGKSAPVKLASVQVERYGLVKEGSAKFPLDGYGQVKEAVSWFNDYHQSLHPADRHEFAVKLASRANELDIKVSDLIKKYGSVEYAPNGEINVAVATRMQHWAEDAPERDMLKGLMSKQASVQPEVFCEALRQFDEATGLTREWDETIYDPWYSTYGFNKQAEWVFSHAGERITSEQLRNFAKSEKYCKIKHTFGDELADGLKKDPEKIFDSLPLDSKRIIMRLAADPQP